MAHNHWGNAITVLNTIINTPYYINFHNGKCGHSLFVGPKDSGKTTLINFLTALSQKYEPRVFYIDSKGNSELFIKALGGQYLEFSI